MEENQNKKPNPKKTFPNNIWMYRKKSGLSQQQMAYLMGHKSAAHVSRYERGVKRPSLENALKLEAVLGNVMVSFLFSELMSQIRREVHARKQKLHRSSPTP